VNGGPAALLFGDGRLFAVLAVDLNQQDGRVRALYTILNPDKLRKLAEQLRTHP
jgi:hypothetical protein